MIAIQSIKFHQFYQMTIIIVINYLTLVKLSFCYSFCNRFFKIHFLILVIASKGRISVNLYILSSTPTIFNSIHLFDVPV